MPISTQRLILIPGVRPVLEAELEGAAELASALGVEVHPSWPPPLYDGEACRWMLDRVIEDPGYEQWGFRYFVLRQDPHDLAIGAGGFKGPPTPEGDIEIGYSIVPEYQRRGFATEATLGLVTRALSSSRVRRVIAETLPDLTASIRVLESAGFEPASDPSDPQVVRFQRLRPQ